MSKPDFKLITFPAKKLSPLEALQKQLDELIHAGGAVHSALVVTYQGGEQIILKGK